MEVDSGEIPLCDSCGHRHIQGVRCTICGHIGKSQIFVKMRVSNRVLMSHILNKVVLIYFYDLNIA